MEDKVDSPEHIESQKGLNEAYTGFVHVVPNSYKAFTPEELEEYERNMSALTPKGGDSPSPPPSFHTGKKAHIVGLSSILFGIVGMITGQVDFNTGARFILEGLGIITLRIGIGRTGK